MKFISLFTGIGGFDLAFKNAGMECAWMCEIDKKCQEVLRKNFNGVKIYDDVRSIGRDNTESVDLICGGFPCQDLSIAGKRAGLAGERSGLWFEFARIIDEIEPKWVVAENVPGLLSSNRGRDFAVIIRWMAERGYGVSWRILDAQYFGVPQRRRRVFIVGSLGSGRSAEVLFERESSIGDTAPSRETGEGTAAATLRGFGHGWQGQHNDTNSIMTYMVSTADDGRKDRPNGGMYVNQTDIGNGISSKTEILIAETFRMTAFGEYSDDGSASAIKQRDYKGATDLITWEMSHTDDVVRENGNTAPTLQQRMGTGGNQVPMVGVRRLTPTECERLQGFPDGWTDGQSDSTRYRQLGNAVAVPVVEWIGKRIMEANQ